MLVPALALLAAAPLELTARLDLPPGAPSDHLRAELSLAGAAPRGAARLVLGWSLGGSALFPAGLDAGKARVERDEAGRAILVHTAPGARLALRWTWQGQAGELAELLGGARWEGAQPARARLDATISLAPSLAAWRAGGACTTAKAGRVCRARGLTAVRLVSALAPRGAARSGRATAELSRGDPAEVAALADRALAALERLLGPSPGPVQVVDSLAAAHGGLAAAGLVVLHPALLEKSDAEARELRALAVAHEVAHRWLGGAIAAAEDLAPALWEALAQHLAARALPALLPGAAPPRPVELYARTWALYRAAGGRDLDGRQPPSDYAPAELAAIFYARVPAGLARAEALLGAETFERSLGALAARFAGRELCATCLRDAWAGAPRGAEAWGAVESALAAGSGALVFPQGAGDSDGGSSSSRTTSP